MDLDKVYANNNKNYKLFVIILLIYLKTIFFNINKTRI
jgi:hypothetical protein